MAEEINAKGEGKALALECDVYSEENVIKAANCYNINMDGEEFYGGKIVAFTAGGKTARVSDESYRVWGEEVIDFLESSLGLSKETRIKSRIVTHHKVALYS